MSGRRRREHGRNNNGTNKGGGGRSGRGRRGVAAPDDEAARLLRNDLSNVRSSASAKRMQAFGAQQAAVLDNMDLVREQQIMLSVSQMAHWQDDEELADLSLGKGMTSMDENSAKFKMVTSFFDKTERDISDVLDQLGDLGNSIDGLSRKFGSVSSSAPGPSDAS